MFILPWVVKQGCLLKKGFKKGRAVLSQQITYDENQF